jgi:hypothetical protein
LQEIVNLKSNNFSHANNFYQKDQLENIVNPAQEKIEENKLIAYQANNGDINDSKLDKNTSYVNQSALNKQIEKIESNDVNELAINTQEFELIKEKIEKTIDRKLNATDWNVLNILLKEPEVSNKDIAEKAFMSVDGIGSSLRRMYLYFDIKETKYKKIALIMEAIKASKI